MGLIATGAAAKLDRYIGFYEPLCVPKTSSGIDFGFGR
jgi:hypothetical protein